MQEQYPVDEAWISQQGFEAESFPALSLNAVDRLRKAGPSAIVCGPISTGGYGSAAANFAVFNKVIVALQARGVKVFSQMPYEAGIGKLRQAWQEAGNTGYCMAILEEFYAPLFATGLFSAAFFIPEWESSFGACWEHAECHRLGIRIYYLKRSWIASL